MDNTNWIYPYEYDMHRKKMLLRMLLILLAIDREMLLLGEMP